MKREELFDELVRAARREPAQAIDVVGDVMRRIRAERPEPALTLAVMSVVSAAAAAIVMTFALQAWAAWQDPMTGLFCSMSMVLE
jgi:hypothetical protein